MRRFLIVHDHVIIARGVSFDDDVVGVRWGSEPRMTLVFMSNVEFTVAIDVAGKYRRGVTYALG